MKDEAWLKWKDRTEDWNLSDWIREARELASEMVFDEDTKRCLLVLAEACERLRSEKEVQ